MTLRHSPAPSPPDESGLLQRYTSGLLAGLGAPAGPAAVADPWHPAERWADSGLMALTGRPDRLPVVCPVPLASCADACLDAFRALSGRAVLPGVSGAQLLAERAAIAGSGRRGGLSPGGSCRLLASRDGRVGVNLTRAEDWELTPAWIGHDGSPDWHALAARVGKRTTATLVERGRLLGLAVADASRVPDDPTPWCHAARHGPTAPVRRPAPRVLDLSSLWAGPLCSHLWQRAGAEVIKVESARRPDGARSGSVEFFRLLNDGKASLTLDLHTDRGRRELLELARSVDIVLEGSRPRALRQMGLVAESLLASRPGLTWVSITGYGRREPAANWVAFGDDAGVAAGLSAILHQVTGDWLICGDAVADPLTGLHAALAGWAGWLSGGGRLFDLSLAGTVRHCITATAPPANDYRDRHRQWRHHLEQRRTAVQPPRRRGEVPASTP